VLPVVRKLQFEGVHQVSESDLREKILTGETFWLTGWLPEWFPFADRKYFEPNAWRSDVKRIERYYQSQGFYQAKVLSQDVKQTGQDVQLTVKVEEGSPTRVTSLDIDGLDGLQDNQRKRALANLPIKVGQNFREDDWNALKAKLPEVLRDQGYAKASTEGEARVDVERKSAQLKLEVLPGLRYRFGQIEVTEGPNAKVPPDEIAAQARSSIKPGRYYSDDAINEAQNRVTRMGVFGAVKVQPGQADDEDETIPVVVDTRESPFHTLRVGGGIGLDPIRQEIRARADYTDRDFLGGLRKLTLSARAGYAFIPSVVAVIGNIAGTAPVSAPFYSLSANFEQPHFLAEDLRFTATLENDSNIEQAYQYIGGDARAGVIWQPHSSFVIKATYNFEAYRLWGESSLVDANGGANAPLLTYGCKGTPCNEFLSFLEEVIEWDRRDSPLRPHKGFFLSVAFQEGGGPLGGSYTYLRVMPDLRYFQPLGPRFTLAGRVHAGTLIPLSNEPSPIVARFFAGGANSMRGFGTNRLSPLQAVGNPTNVTSPSTLAAPVGALPGYTYGQIDGLTVPIGGNGLFEASLELRWDITNNFTAAIFGDAGMVTQENFAGWGPETEGTAPLRQPYFQNMQYAVGFGFRYMTPVGPIRIDLAHRLNIGPPLEVLQAGGGQSIYYPTQGTCFGIFDKGQHISGAPEGPCAFHISFGEAF
jgi:translocation and assembly module TamA